MPRTKRRRRSPTRLTEPGSGLTRRPRIDKVLARPDLQDLMATAKHHFAVAAGIDHVLEPARHQAAAIPASVAVWQMVDGVRSEPGNANLPERAVYNYIVDRMFASLTASIATEEERRHVYLPVRLPAGRPPSRRSQDRQTLIDEIRARPDMHDFLIADRAVTRGVWRQGLAGDPVNVKRRIRGLRQAAAKSKPI